MRGKKCELEDDEDLNGLYASYSGKRTRTISIYSVP